MFLGSTAPRRLSWSPVVLTPQPAQQASLQAPQLGFQSPTAAGVEASSSLLRERWQPFQILHINGGTHGNQMLNMVQQGKRAGFSLPLRGWLMLTLIHNYKTRTRSQVRSFIFKPCASCTEKPTPTPPSPPPPPFLQVQLEAFTRCGGLDCSNFFSFFFSFSSFNLVSPK